VLILLLPQFWSHLMFKMSTIHQLTSFKPSRPSRLHLCSLIIGSSRSVTDISINHDYRQASARPQCSCSCHNQHQQVGYDSGLSIGYCIMTFTGWMLLSAFSFEWLLQYTSVYTAWLQLTWPNCVRPSLRQQVAVVCFGLPRPATWSCLAVDCQPMAPVPSASLVQSAGMLYRIIWSHQTFHLIVSDTSWKHFYFVDTRPSTISTTSAH